MQNDEQYIAAFLLLYLAVFGVILLFAAAFYVVMSLCLSRFFAKVGIEPWIAWVPVYNTWKWLELGGQKGWLALLAVIPYGGIASSVFLYVGMHRSGIAFRKDSSWIVLGIFLPFVWAYLLSRPQETYEPHLISEAGYPPPLAGFGAVPPAA